MTAECSKAANCALWESVILTVFLQYTFAVILLCFVFYAFTGY